MLDDAGDPVRLTDRGLLTGAPTWLSSKRIDAWAGPWLLDEHWWTRGRDTAPTARLQLVTADGAALLVRSTGDGWQVEGVYD